MSVNSVGNAGATVPVQAARPPAAAAGAALSAAADRTLGPKVGTEVLVNKALDYGLSPETVAKIQANPTLAKELQTLPPDVMGLFKTLTGNEKHVLTQELYGKTKVGFISVDHRQAFITGKGPMGIDAFPIMESHIDDHIKNGDLNGKEGGALKDALGMMKNPSGGHPGLNPDQRSAIVQVLEMEIPPQKH